MAYKFAATLVLLLGFTVAVYAEGGMLLFPNSDFEQGTLENWRLEGAAFYNQPTQGDNVRARVSTRRAMPQGRYWASSYEHYQGQPRQRPGAAQGDAPIGAILSEPFIIEKRHIGFLVNGGRGDKMQVQLIVQGRVVHSTTGAESPFLRRVLWDVSDYLDQKAQIYVFDRSSEAWGQIGVDDFRYYDEPPNLELFPNSDFGMGNLENWNAEGGAFNEPPMEGDKDAKGTLTSIPFEIKGEAVTFNIAGGSGEDTRVELLVDGEAIFSQSAFNNTTHLPVVWDVGEYKGRIAEIRITDDSTGEWGYVSVDAFRYARELEE